MKKLGPENVLYPMPTTLVGATTKGKPNFITIVHVGIMNHGKPRYLSISLAKRLRKPARTNPSSMKAKSI